LTFNEETPNETFSIPSSAVEAWAAVYIDVAEKLDANTLDNFETQTLATEDAKSILEVDIHAGLEHV
jgi:hypothetical protein